MEYKGKLYGKIANKYIDLEVTSDEFDAMKKQIEEHELYGMEKRAELEELEKENNSFFDENEHLKRQLEKEKELSEFSRQTAIDLKNLLEKQEREHRGEVFKFNKLLEKTIFERDDYKQIAFKQKDDLENKFEDLQNDIKFLYEMKQRAINAFDKKDASEQQYLYKMIDDWIHQLSSASAKTEA